VIGTTARAVWAEEKGRGMGNVCWGCTGHPQNRSYFQNRIPRPWRLREALRGGGTDVEPVNGLKMRWERRIEFLWCREVLGW
jgi:hypothetical protein